MEQIDNNNNIPHENYHSDNNNNNNNNNSVWIFGYGSLCWHPGFEFTKCITGYVRGYVRRFWQGNTTHRGTKEKPGRVVTLVEHHEGITWGCAYEITGNLSLKYLKQRECTLGGYTTKYTKFYPRIAIENAAVFGGAFPVLLYIATDKNQLWLGDDTLINIANQIVDGNGPSGHNVEYLMRLANFMREEIDVTTGDDHLFELEKLVKEILVNRQISLISVMGLQPQQIIRDAHLNIHLPTTFEHTSRVPDKKLRCLNI